MKLFIVLPCFNESQSLPTLLDSIHKVVCETHIDYEIVVIDDGSEDNTGQVAVASQNIMNISVFKHESNKGLGEAVKTGLTHFYDSSSSDDVAVIMDADNTHNPNLIPYMLEIIKSGCDVVIASRYVNGGQEVGLPFLRRMFSLVANLMLSVCFAVPNVRDYTCGCRAYSRGAIERVIKVYGDDFITEKGFTCMAEILVKLHYTGSKVSEVPLVLRYDLKSGASKMRVLKTIVRYFVLIYNLKRQPAFNTVILNGKEK